MAAARSGMLSHPVQNEMMASSDYPDWLTAEHRTGVSEVFVSVFSSFLCLWKLIYGHVL